MVQQKSILLDIPYTLSLLEPMHRAILTSGWGVCPWFWVQEESPRLQTLDELKEEALWYILLYGRVLFANPTVKDMRMRGRVGTKSLSPELYDLAKLSEKGLVELIDSPESEGLPEETDIDSDFALAMKELVRSDLQRDGELVSNWEYRYLVSLIGTEERKELQSLFEKEIEPLREKLFRIVKMPKDQALTIDDLVQNIPSSMLQKHKLMPSKRYCDKLRQVLLSRDVENRLRNYSFEQLDSLYGKLHSIEFSCDRLKRVFLVAKHRQADLKIDAMIPKTTVAQEATIRKGLQGENLYRVVSIFLDEVKAFPQLKTVRDVERHLDKKYITDLRETIFAWSEAVNEGSIKDAEKLRGKVRDSIAHAIKEIGRWRKASFVLGVVQKIATASTIIPGWSIIAAPIALGAETGKEMTAKKAAELEKRRGWLLFGHDL
ncbi:hypothetical protein M1N05_00495 [Dehalococcoidales bacterium]|nr:hypothetical protein [Dehalococcoidales bacterium]